LALDPLPAGVVAFKSIAAYRSGLRIDVDPPADVVECVRRHGLHWVMGVRACAAAKSRQVYSVCFKTSSVIVTSTFVFQ
jgi:hypothetical protein